MSLYAMTYEALADKAAALAAENELLRERLGPAGSKLLVELQLLRKVAEAAGEVYSKQGLRYSPLISALAAWRAAQVKP